MPFVDRNIVVWRMHDRLGTCAAKLEVGTYYCVCAMRTKWQLIHPEMPVKLSVSLFDSLAEFICSKGSSSVGYRVAWYINHRLQSNHFVGRRDEEEEEEEKDGENRAYTDFFV